MLSPEAIVGVSHALEPVSFADLRTFLPGCLLRSPLHIKVMSYRFSLVRPAKFAALALGATAAVACSDSTTPSGPRGVVQFVNAAPQKAYVDLKVNAATTVNNLPYSVGTQFFVKADTGLRLFTAYDSLGTTALDETSFNIADGDAYTLVLVQAAPGGSLSNLLYFPDTVSAPASGKAKVRFVNTSPSQTSLDVYVLAANATSADLDTATTLSPAHIAYKATLPYQEVTAGAHRIVFTTAGTKTVVADVTNRTLTNGQAYTFLTLDKVGGGTPVTTFYWTER